MKTLILILGFHVSLLLVPHGAAQSTFQMANKNVNAPIFDATGAPLAGVNFQAELYGGATSDALAPAMSIFAPFPQHRIQVPFLTGTNAGYFVSGETSAIVSVTPGGFAWLQVRAWDSRLGTTYEEVAALGLGGYGASTVFYADGGNPLMLPPEAAAPLVGLQSFRLLPEVPEPSIWVLLTLGGVTIRCALRLRRRDAV